MEDFLSQFVAYNNNLTTFFSNIFEQAPAISKKNKKPPILIHSALSAFGSNIPGAERTILHPLLRVSSRHKQTILMPSHADEAILKNNPKQNTCLGMGRIANRFSKSFGIKRSEHPLLSFSGRGSMAKELLKNHSPETGLGFYSPLGKLLNQNALVLMLGTDWTSCTAMHLIEYYYSNGDTIRCWAHLKGKDILWDDIPFYPKLFLPLGELFEKEQGENILSGPIPQYSGYKSQIQKNWKLFSMEKLYEFCIDRYPLFR